MKLAHDDSARYVKEHRSYISSLSFEELVCVRDMAAQTKMQREDRRLKSLLRKLERPKGPKTAFNLFCLKMKVHNKPITENMKQVAESWRAMSSSEKQVYQEEAEMDKRRYLDEMTNWEVLMEETGNAHILRQLDRRKASSLLYSRRLGAARRRGDDIEKDST